MGAISEEFERELDALRKRYAADPHQELIQLCLLSLEREELVSVAYREDRMEARLRTMPLSEEARELLLHALVWAWKDEEMHAMYVRGLLFQLGGPALRGRALLLQRLGAIAGWAGSVRHHVRPTQAPVSWLCATAITAAGRLLGKVPEDVGRYLDYGPFRDFCRFNVDAERTAWLCWNRMRVLAGKLPTLPAHLEQDFRQVEEDEARHERIFDLFARSLDESDRLLPGVTPALLAEQLTAIGEHFLPRPLRRAAADRTLGSNRPVHHVRGTPAESKRVLFRALIEAAGLPAQLRERAARLGRSLETLHVAIKVNFMLGYDRQAPGSRVDPDLVEELALVLREAGCRDVAVVERPNLYEQFFAHRSVAEVAGYFGYTSSAYRVVDASGDAEEHTYPRGMGQHRICRTWRDADFRISFAKLAGHPTELVHLTLCNLEGLGVRLEEFLFVERQAQLPTVVLTLADAFPPDFALLEGYDHAPDGLMGFLRSPRPLAARCLYAGADALAVDTVAARHLGFSNPRDIPLLRAAHQWFGRPQTPPAVEGPDEPVPGWRTPFHNEWSTLLATLAWPVWQFGSGRGDLFLPPMDEEAFPPHRPFTTWERLRRRIVGALLELGGRR